MNPYTQIIRPLNCAMAGFGVLIGGIVGIGIELFEPEIFSTASLAAVVAFLITGAGNTLNDYYDREIDRINHPERPIPSRRIAPKSAVKLAGALFVVGVLLAFFVNTLCLLIAVANSYVLLLYERNLKRRGLGGNVAVSYLTASIFLFGGAAVAGNLFDSFRLSPIITTAILALLAGSASLGREIVKDIEDIAGDADRLTLPKKIGVKKSALASAFSFLAAVALSPLPYYLGMLSFYYIPIVAVADIIFIYCITLSIKNPRRASTMAKAGMLIALSAFLIGGAIS